MLTKEECAVLSLVAKRTKMDCWFAILHTANGQPYIYDLENKKRIGIKTAIPQLSEGVEDYDNYHNCRLTPEEDRVFRELIKKYGGEQPPIL